VWCFCIRFLAIRFLLLQIRSSFFLCPAIRFLSCRSVFSSELISHYVGPFPRGFAWDSLLTKASSPRRPLCHFFFITPCLGFSDLVSFHTLILFFKALSKCFKFFFLLKSGNINQDEITIFCYLNCIFECINGFSVLKNTCGTWIIQI
jgi:hypothetical protein